MVEDDMEQQKLPDIFGSFCCVDKAGSGFFMYRG